MAKHKLPGVKCQGKFSLTPRPRGGGSHPILEVGLPPVPHQRSFNTLAPHSTAPMGTVQEVDQHVLHRLAEVRRLAAELLRLQCVLVERQVAGCLPSGGRWAVWGRGWSRFTKILQV